MCVCACACVAFMRYRFSTGLFRRTGSIPKGHVNVHVRGCQTSFLPCENDYIHTNL